MQALYVACIASSGLAMVGITLMIPAGVFMRYVMNDPLQWPEPASVIMMVMFSFLGGAAVYRHELIHSLQSVRSAALVDVLLHQDAAQSRPLGFLRFNSGILSLGRVQTLLGGDLEHDLRFDEWEADAYSLRSMRLFQIQ